MTQHDFTPWLKYDIIVQPFYVFIQLCRKNPGVHKMWSQLGGRVWREPLIVLVCIFVSLCEIISGVLFAVDHLTASFRLNSLLCNSLADPVTFMWLQLLAAKGFLQVMKFNLEFRVLPFIVCIRHPVTY